MNGKQTCWGVIWQVVVSPATFAVIKVGFCWVLPVNYQRVVT